MKEEERSLGWKSVSCDLVGAIISSVTQTLSLSEEVFQTVNH